MSFTEGVLRLVRIGARIDPAHDPARLAAPPGGSADPALAAVELDDLELDAESCLAQAQADADLAGPTADSPYLEPGFADIEAAVALVEAGLATRVVLTGFPSWPGLLYQARELAESAGVQVLPTVVRPGGRVDIVIMRDTRPDV